MQRGYVRALTSASFMVLSGLVKFLSGIGFVFLLVGVLRATPGRRQRGMLLGATLVWTALLTILLFAPWLELPDSLDPILRQTGGNLYANAIPDLVSLTVADQALNPAGVPFAAARDAARLVMKVLVDLAFVVYLVWEVRQVWRAAAVGGGTALAGVVRATARASLVLIMVVSIWVQPWYFILPLGVAVLLGMRDVVARVAVAYTLTALVGLYVHYYLQDAVPGVVYLAYAFLPLLVAVKLSRAVVPSRTSGGWYHRARDAVRLIDERGQTLVPNAARSAAVAEVDRSATDDGTRR